MLSMDLRAAAGTAPEHVAVLPSDIETATRVREGDIRLVEPLPGAEAEPRMALVVRAYSGPVDVAEVLLAHTCVEMATPNDAVLEPDDTGLGHSLVVQTRLRGPVWQSQLTQPLGRLPQAHMAAIAQIYSLDGAPPKVRTGSRDPDSPEALRRFKDSERAALDALAGDCAHALIDDGAPWQLDPDLASPRMVLSCDDPELVATAVAHFLRTRRVAATAECLRLMQQSDALDCAAWQQVTGDYGLASEIVGRIESLMASKPHEFGDFSPDSPAPAPPLKMPPRIPAARDLMLHGERRLVTAPFLWQISGDHLLERACGGEEPHDNCYEVYLLAPRVACTSPLN